MLESPANFTGCRRTPAVSEGARRSPLPPIPQASGDRQRATAQRSPGVCWGAAGGGARPPYHLHLTGVELAGGRGHGELDLLAVLGVHGGRSGRRGWGRATRGPGLRSQLGSPALLGAPRQQRAVCGEEEEGCSRTDKNTALGEGGRASREEGSAAARRGRSVPALGCAGPRPRALAPAPSDSPAV